MSQGAIKRLTDTGFDFIENGTGTDMFFHMSAVEGCRFEELRTKARRCPTTKGVGRRDRAKSRRGTEVAATLYTVIETTKLHDIDPSGYIHAAVLAADHAEVSLPWQFAMQSRDEQRSA